MNSNSTVNYHKNNDPVRFTNEENGVSIYIPRNQYEEIMINKQRLRQQANEYCKKMLNENYPVKFVIFHSILLLILSIAAIVLETIIIVKKNTLVGVGIWVGAFFLLPAAFDLILIKHRKLSILSFTLFLYSFGFLILITGIILASIQFSAPDSSLHNSLTYVLIPIFAVLFVLKISFLIKMCKHSIICNNPAAYQYYST